MYHIWTLFHPLNRWVTLPWYSNTMGSWKFSLLRKTDASSRPLHRRTVSLVFWSHSYLKLLLTSDCCFRPAHFQWLGPIFTSSTLIYTSELIPYSTICAHRATFSVRPRCSVGRITVDLNRRSWSRFTPRSKDFFFTSCGSLILFTRANAQWVTHGFN